MRTASHRISSSITSFLLILVILNYEMPLSAEQPRVDVFGDELPLGALVRMGTVRYRHGTPPVALSFLDGGRSLIGGGRDAVIRIWDAASGRPLRTFIQPAGSQVMHFAISPDGNVLAAATASGIVDLWDVSTGRIDATLTGNDGPATSVAFSPDGEFLASGYENGVVRLWTTRDHKELLQLTSHAARVHAVSFSDDGKLLASASSDNTIAIWNVPARQFQTALTGHSGSVMHMQFAPQGRLLASQSQDHTLRLWDVTEGKCLHQIEAGGALTFSADGKLLAFVTRTLSHVSVFSIEPKPREVRVLKTLGDTVSTLAFSDDSTTLAAGIGSAYCGGVCLWNVATGGILNGELGHIDPVECIAFEADRKSVISGTLGGSLIRWELATGKQHTSRKAHDGPIRSVSLSTGAPYAASGGDDGIVQVWRLPGLELVQMLARHRAAISAVVWSPGGAFLVTCDRSGDVFKWKPDDGQVVGAYIAEWSSDKPNSGPTSLAYSSDGSQLAVGGNAWVRAATKDRPVSVQPSICVFDPMTEKLLSRFGNPEARVSAMCYAHTTNTLVVSGASVGTVYLFDTAMGKVIGRMEGIGGSRIAFAVSPDDRVIAWTSLDGLLHISDFRSGRQIRQQRAHLSNVQAVVYSSDGELVATSSYDGTILVWDSRYLETGIE